MMRNYGEGDRNSVRRHRGPQDTKTISGTAEIRQKMIDHVYDIVENREQHLFNVQVCHNRDLVRNSQQNVFLKENSKLADAVKLKSSVNPLERKPGEG